MSEQPSRKNMVLPGVAGLMLVIGILLIGVPIFAQSRQSASAQAQSMAAASIAAAQSAPTPSSAAAAKVATDKSVFPPTPALITTSVANAPATAAGKPVASTPAAPSVDAYKGLGSWVDIYDDKAWNNPTAAVRDMSSHGVKTLFIETSNTRSSSAFVHKPELETFVREAHARGIRVVAWYLPDMNRGSLDYERVAQAIKFHTSDGQKFDGFALDIESSAVGSESERNRDLKTLSTKLRTLAGPSYPLGAIIPSPVGLSKKAGYWDSFPYAWLASKYNVFVPMAYWTYHGSGASEAYADAKANIRILRSQPGCSATPIHMIGGISDSASTAEVQAFVRAVREAGVAGASLYGWVGTKGSMWQQMKAITR